MRSYLIGLVFCLGLCGPAAALDNGGGGSSDIKAACDNSHRLCLASCYSMEGTKFSDEMRRQGCELGCNQAYDACIKSIPVIGGSGGMSHKPGHKGFLGN